MSLLNNRLTSFLPKAIQPSSLNVFRSSVSQLRTTSSHKATSSSRPCSLPIRAMSTSAATTGKANPFLETVLARRTIYALNKTSPISQSRIEEIIRHTVLHTPSSFNSQTTRVIFLVGEEHDKLWEIVKESVKAVAPAEVWPQSEQRLNGFKAGYGTILFFDDSVGVKGMQESFAAYADKFPGWAAESNAMHQYAIWCALEAEGLGANLQHYSPLIDLKVANAWNVPLTWELKAQLVIGGRAGEPYEKTFKPLEERFFVYGA